MSNRPFLGVSRLPYRGILLEGEDLDDEQSRLHPHTPLSPAEGIREIPHLLLLCTLQDRAEDRESRETSLRPGATFLSRLLDGDPGAAAREHGGGAQAAEACPETGTRGHGSSELRSVVWIIPSVFFPFRTGVWSLLPSISVCARRYACVESNSLVHTEEDVVKTTMKELSMRTSISIVDVQDCLRSSSMLVCKSVSCTDALHPFLGLEGLLGLMMVAVVMWNNQTITESMVSGPGSDTGTSSAEVSPFILQTITGSVLRASGHVSVCCWME